MTYISPSGRAEPQDDINRLDDQGLARFEAQVRYLSATTVKGDWTAPQAKKLKGYEALYEIRFKNQRQATRAIGFFGPGDGEFTITLLCYHKDDIYKPKDALATADLRRRQILDGTGRATPLLIDGEEFPPIAET